jgi:hypothetical protein
LSGAEQLIGLSLGPGHKQVEFTLRPTVAEKAGTAASILGCFALAAFMAFVSRSGYVKALKGTRSSKKPSLVDDCQPPNS